MFCRWLSKAIAGSEQTAPLNDTAIRITTTMIAKLTSTAERPAAVRTRSPAKRDARHGITTNWLNPDPAVREAVVRMVVSCGHVALSDAEDLVMDAVVKLQHLQAHPRNARALLFTAAMNGLRSRRRILGFRTRTSLPEYDRGKGATVLDSLESPDPGGLAQLETKETEVLRRQMLHEALRRLSAMDREVLTAYYFENRPLISIDQLRGDRIGAAKVRLFRARRRLQRMLAIGFSLRLAA